MIKSYRPTSKSRRAMTTLRVPGLASSAPRKSLTHGFKRWVGRNSAGRISTRHKGGGHKRLYREVDFMLSKRDVPATVESVEYDPNRSAHIALVRYADGARSYVLASGKSKTGDVLHTSLKAPAATGNRLPLKSVPVGTFVHNIEVKPGGGGKLVRAAGSFAQVLSNDLGYSMVKMPSGEVRRISEACWATVGAVSNEEHNLVTIGKAGRSRWKGIRPTVRGSAMNPVDHPYGGGEGRQGRGTRRPKTMWGKITGGRKTRHPKKYSNVFIVSRRPKRLRKK